MRSYISTTLALIMLFTSSVIAVSASNATTPATHSYKRRELSDSEYNRLAIIHASGTYLVLGLREIK